MLSVLVIYFTFCLFTFSHGSLEVSVNPVHFTGVKTETREDPLFSSA